MLGIYCRISKKKEEGKDTSIQTQKDRGIQFAVKNGLSYKIYVDEGISGQKLAGERESLDNLFDDVESKKVDSVWVIDQSRFERSEILWQDFQIMIARYKIEFYIGDTRFDLENEDMRLMGNIMSSINASYARRTGKKVKDSYEARFKAGKWVGITPFGYTTDKDGYLIVDESQAKIVKRIFEESKSGIGAYTIANKFNEDAVPVKSSQFEGKTIKKKDPYTKVVKEISRENVKWRGNVISGIIQNPIYKGVWILNKGKDNEQIRTAPAIIDSNYYDSVIDNLVSNRKNVGKRATYQYLINGLVYCSNCGKQMRGKKRAKGSDSAYKCAGGVECRGINIAKFETFIINHLFYNKGLKELLTAAPKAGDVVLKGLEKRIEKSVGALKKIESKLKRLLLMNDDEELSNDTEIIEEYKKTRKRKFELEAKIKIDKDELHSISNDIPSTRLNSLIDNFRMDMSFDDIKKSVHLLIDKILVSYNATQKDFTIVINYKGFSDYSIFKVNTILKDWYLKKYVRNQATNEKQLNTDNRIIKMIEQYYGKEVELPEDWKGLAIDYSDNISGVPSFKLTKENLIIFE